MSASLSALGKRMAVFNPAGLRGLTSIHIESKAFSHTPTFRSVVMLIQLGPAIRAEFRTLRLRPTFGAMRHRRLNLHLHPTIRTELRAMRVGSAFRASRACGLDHGRPAFRAELRPRRCQCTVIRTARHLLRGIDPGFDRLSRGLKHPAQSKRRSQPLERGSRLLALSFADFIQSRAVFVAYP